MGQELRCKRRGGEGREEAGPAKVEVGRWIWGLGTGPLAPRGNVQHTKTEGWLVRAK